MNDLHKAILCIVISCCTAVLFITKVPLIPQVIRNFFFSADDPQLKADGRITKIFGDQEQILISVAGNLNSKSYVEYIKKFSDSLLAIDHVFNVKSLTHGPENLKEAKESPLWKRLLISKDKKSSNILVLVDKSPPEEFVPRIIETAKQFKTKYFTPYIAGIPYMIDLIRASLTSDLIIFSITSILIFSIAILIIFRSFPILLGTLICCLNAVVLTLFVTYLLNIQIGVLTANVVTIIFVLTLSHIVFLTHAWDSFPENISKKKVKKVIRHVISTCALSMIAAIIGFGNLIFADAKPLQELGITGALGALFGFSSVFCFFRFFLIFRSTNPKKIALHSLFAKFSSKKHTALVLSVIFIALICLPGTLLLNTDPPLLSYFKKGGEIRTGLEYIDTNGGSSPLRLVITSPGSTLIEKNGFERMWKLQRKLERDPAVGSVISLPIIMAQGNEHPLSFFFSWDALLDIMNDPTYDAITKKFVSEDRKLGYFFLRMREQTENHEPRKDVIARIQDHVSTSGYQVKDISGMYVLQGQMSELIKKSVLNWLSNIPIFILIALLISRSLRIALTLGATICLIPAIILGTAGYCGIAVDLITAPAASIAVALGVDELFHFIKELKRQKGKTKTVWELCVKVRTEVAKPILSSLLIVGSGFMSFLLSNFPPTQRFGLFVVFGIFVAILNVLVVFPWLVGKMVKWESI